MSFAQRLHCEPASAREFSNKFDIPLGLNADLQCRKKERIFALWAARKIFLVHEENLPRETAKNNLRKRQSEKKKKINN